MTSRQSYALAVVTLLLAALLRFWDLADLPPGLNDLEVPDARIVETVRAGQVEVLYNIGDEGREGLYHAALAAVTAFVGAGTFGYRVLSAWLSLITLALVYTLSRRLHGPIAALASLLFLTTVMWPVLLGRTVAREVLLIFMVAAVLMALARSLPVYLRPGSPPTTSPFAALGLLLGLGFYVHPTHYLVVLMSMLFIAYMLFTRQPMSRRTLSYISFSIVVLVISAMPYLISSLRRSSLSGATRLLADYTLIIEQGLPGTLLAALGGFFIRGDASVLSNVPGRPLMDPITGILVVVGIGFAARYWQYPRFALPLIGLLSLFGVAVLSPNSPNFYAYTALLPLLAVFFGLAVAKLYEWWPQPVSSSAITVVLCVLLLANVGWTSYSLFVVWGNMDDVQTVYRARVHRIARYMDQTTETVPTVVCVPNFEPGPNALPDPARVGTVLTLMTHRRDTPVRYADCGTGLVLANGGEAHQIILLGGSVMRDMHPYIRDWLRQGQMIESQGLPPNAVVAMNVHEVLGATVGRFTTTAPAGFAPEAPGGAEAALLPVQFSNNMTFLGYETDTIEDTYEPGDIVTNITYWRVDGEIPADLRLFTHVLFDAESIISQSDTISVLARRLQPRDVFIQVTFVPLPDATPDETYQISIGAYEQRGNRRLAILDEGQPRGNRLFLNDIMVVGG